MFGNRMQTSAIPERVYVLCREVVNKQMDEETVALSAPGGELSFPRTSVALVKLVPDLSALDNADEKEE